jgi:hypothetical protein
LLTFFSPEYRGFQIPFPGINREKVHLILFFVKYFFPVKLTPVFLMIRLNLIFIYLCFKKAYSALFILIDIHLITKEMLNLILRKLMHSFDLPLTSFLLVRISGFQQIQLLLFLYF